MSDLGPHIVTVFFGLLAIMNPIANTPIFLSLTDQQERSRRSGTAGRAVLLAFAIVSVCAVSGSLIFEAFGITLTAFRVTGGLLVFLIGFQMLQGGPSPVHHPSKEDRAQQVADERDVAVSPLAIPILAGPGTIAAAMNYAAPGGVEIVVTLAAFAVLCVLTYVCFVSGDRLVAFFGQSAINVITRIMGLILAVIGTQMFLDGIREAALFAPAA